MKIIRFLFCLRLRYYGDNVYEVDGFTTSIKATKDDLYTLVVPDSGREEKKKEEVNF